MTYSYVDFYDFLLNFDVIIVDCHGPLCIKIKSDSLKDLFKTTRAWLY